MNALREELERNGYACVPDLIRQPLLDQLRDDLATAIDRCRQVQLENGITQRTEQTAHHILTPGSRFVELLASLAEWGLADTLGHMLGGVPILNSFGGLNNLNSTDAYVRNVHRDVRSWSAENMQMAQALVLLDDFTVDNGATLFLPGSHTEPQKPDDTQFEVDARKALGSAGSVYLFDSRIWHAAGINRTPDPRRCLTLTFTRSYFKPQFDYCRALGEAFCLAQPAAVQQLLGWHARTPSTLHEWYQPEDQRFYRKNQG
ncbi:phytanoyl-CoA dioxygenase family protein [Pseudomonas sp. UFMG81]|jgi:ectoine hydroxylase-related dioxygenase (phytanoyl-CoA dioxygenase family)|uniref:phytanoyl-CoA dioxygenase family protein n=1 Tax=Pseudomonas sp. UFMG81 TaxID=2745936 RepID=UPI0018906816|nr:phytanoyl-CoA dioxygenase family protein [Pseudomonas sp. UFMG81]